MRMMVLASFVLVTGVRVVHPMSPPQDSTKPKMVQPDGNVQLAARRLPGRVLKVAEVIGKDSAGNDLFAPLEGVSVHEVVLGLQATTTKSGMVGLWAFQSLTDTVTIELKKVGYVAGALKVPNVTADTTPVEVIMERATVLDVVKVNATKYHFAGADEFEERMNRHITGHFITPEEMNKYALSNTSWPVILNGRLRSSSACKRGGMAIFVDGRPTDLLPHVQTVAAVEVYSAAQAPLQYGGTKSKYTDCNVVLVWTLPIAK